MDKTGCAMLGCFVFAVATAAKADEKVDDYMARRIKSAESIIKEARQYQADAVRLHTKLEAVIAQAKRLQGEASYLRAHTTNVNAPVKLSAAELKSAVGQYQADLDQFRMHAQDYENHLNIFRNTIGECHANEDAFRKLAAETQLHVDQFHIQTMKVIAIRPPHVCGVMESNFSSATAAAQQLGADMARVQSAQLLLQDEQNKLRQNAQLSGALDNKVVLGALRNKREQEIYAEFGKLREEYQALLNEKNILAANGKTNIKLSSSSVHASIKR